MKKILSVALVATLLAASCSKTEIINPVGNQMGFSGGLGKLTKADDPATTLKDQDFRVWAYYVAEDIHTGAAANSPYDKIENVEVAYDETESMWTTTEQYYWPGKDKALKFFAVSADQATVGTATVDAVVATDGKVKINDERTTMTIEEFEVPVENPLVDLMVSDVIAQDQDDKVVDLKFHHALSMVDFVFKTIDGGDNLEVTVKSLSVAGLSAKGTLTVTLGAGEDVTTNEGENKQEYTKYPISFGWEPSTDDTDLKDFNKAKVSAPMTLTESAQEFASWMVIPQSVAGKKVNVVYTIGDKEFTANFDLDAASIADSEWKENQHIKYTITLAPNLIKFNPDVQPWDEATNVGHQN